MSVFEHNIKHIERVDKYALDLDRGEIYGDKKS